MTVISSSTNVCPIADYGSASLIAIVARAPDVLERIPVGSVVVKDASGNTDLAANKAYRVGGKPLIAGDGSTTTTIYSSGASGIVFRNAADNASIGSMSNGGDFTIVGSGVVTGNFYAKATMYVGSTSVQNIAADATSLYLRGTTIAFQTAAASATHLIVSSASILPGADNAITNGGPSNRWSNGYIVNAWTVSSDARIKALVGDIPDDWLDAWGDVAWQRYKMRDAVEEKGDGARWHTGVIAQQVDAAFAAHGIDACAIGLLCFDAWNDVVEPIFEKVRLSREIERESYIEAGADETGAPIYRREVVAITEEYDDIVDTGQTRVVRESGELWAVRYDEAQAIEAAWQRRELKRCAARVEALESMLTSGK